MKSGYSALTDIKIRNCTICRKFRNPSSIIIGDEGNCDADVYARITVDKRDFERFAWFTME